MDSVVTSYTIAFRVDASLEIGTGHVMRCLTLADALRVRGAECVFVCRPHRGHLLEQIRMRGHEIRVLSSPPTSFVVQADDTSHAAWLGIEWVQDAEETLRMTGGEHFDWLVIDHYALDRRWEEVLRPVCHQLMVMDDLADRAHDCDLLLDPTLNRKSAAYAGLLPPGSTMLLGSQFALLRPEFTQLRAESLARREAPDLRHLLVTMGGVDKDNATTGVLDALDNCILPPDLRITVVMGAHSPWLDAIRERAAQMQVETHVLAGVTDMARVMLDSDLAIGAAGSTSWERCALGLPTVMLVLADNQRDIAAALDVAGSAIDLGCPFALSFPAILGRVINDIASDSAYLASLSAKSAVITDGCGCVRVVDAIMNMMRMG